MITIANMARSILLASVAVTAAIGGASPQAPAQTTLTMPDLSGNDPHWIKARNSQCWTYNPNPKAGETITWNGACKGQLLSGDGSLNWYDTKNTLHQTSSGTFSSGRLQGAAMVASYDANGVKERTFAGTFTNDSLNGLATETYFNPSGYVTKTYVGIVSNGKYNGKGKVTAFNLDGTTSGYYEGIWQNGTLKSVESGNAPNNQTVSGNGTGAGSLKDGLAAEERGDWKAAFLLLEPLANQGNPVAQFHLGWMFETGKGVNHYVTSPDRLNVKDSTQASIWYRKAAEQGNAQAQTGLGRTFKNLFSEPNPAAYAEAMKWFRKAADQGDADGQVNIGFMYEEGKGGVPHDPAEALKWYRKAADQGNADGQKYLALLQEEVARQKEAATGSPTDLRLVVESRGDLHFQWRGKYPITINRIVINKRFEIPGCDLSGTKSFFLKFPFELDYADTALVGTLPCGGAPIHVDVFTNLGEISRDLGD